MTTKRLLFRAIAAVSIVSKVLIWTETGPRDISSNRSNRGLCTMSELFEGKWVKGKIHDRPPYNPAEGEKQQRVCTDFNSTAKWQDWIWIPSNNCDFINSDAPFNRDIYCSLTANKTVLIMGDSISFDHYLSLTHLMGVPQALPGAKKKDALLKSIVCDRTSTLIGKRDFLLHNVAYVLQQTNPDIIVLNRGAHFESNEALTKFLNASLIPWIKGWQESCQHNGKHCHLIWRTTIPGHPDCQRNAQPLTSVYEMESLIRDHGNPGYHWGEFQYQNWIVKDLLERSSISYDLMDAYYSHILRADWHNPPNDCLHTCLPKENTLSYFFLHQMRIWSDSDTL